MAVVKMCNCCHELKEHVRSNSYTCNECLENGVKWCPMCETAKSIEDFYKKGRLVSSLCKECERKRSLQIKARPESKERKKQYQARPEYKEYMKQYYNRPGVRERVKERYSKPEIKERRRIQAAECRRRQYATEEGRHKVLMNKHNRRAKIHGTVTLAEWKETLDYFDNSCAYCGSTDKITQDHIVPIASGGLNTKHNLVPACRSCNCSKGSRPLVQWYMKQPFATEERLQKVLDFMQKEDEANVIVINHS